ncbi:MAG: hypothetical protein CVT77_12175 [Alphaproteobacteria bacterium HGW-Alphaproteobacteria-16]|nr:MAG: hypothetical protein CVT77_12175 [Alphaproteobacteria bacterium HGW-Alphaproteobacteria-16]
MNFTCRDTETVPACGGGSATGNFARAIITLWNGRQTAADHLSTQKPGCLVTTFQITLITFPKSGSQIIVAGGHERAKFAVARQNIIIKLRTLGRLLLFRGCQDKVEDRRVQIVKGPIDQHRSIV